MKRANREKSNCTHYMTPRTVKDGADISNLRQRMRAKWKIKWGEMHKMFLCQSGQEKFFDFFCFSLPSLCVLLSVWVESLIISWAGLFSGCLCDEAERKHFLAVSWGQCAWKVFEDCEIQDKIDVHLSLSVVSSPCHSCHTSAPSLPPSWHHLNSEASIGCEGT